MNVNEAREFVEAYAGGDLPRLREAVRVLEESGDPDARVWAERGRQALESEQVGLGVEREEDPTLEETTTETSDRFDPESEQRQIEEATAHAEATQTLQESGIEPTGDPEVDAMLAEQVGPGGGGGGDPIGGYFPEDNVSDGPRPVGQPGGPSLDGTNTRSTAYVDGDDVRLLRELPEEQLRRLQDLLVAVGYAPSVTPGEIDDGTVAGFRRLLAVANRNGEPWEATLQRLEHKLDTGEIDDQSEEGQRPGFVEPTRLAPNPDRIREDIEKFGRERLGRDLSPEEVEHLAGTLEELEEADYQRRVEAARGEFEAESEARETGQDQPATEADEFGSEVVASEFGQHFDERYAPEIDRQDRVETGRAVSELLQVGGSLVGSMTGGR